MNPYFKHVTAVVFLIIIIALIFKPILIIPLMWIAGIAFIYFVGMEIGDFIYRCWKGI